MIISVVNSKGGCGKTATSIYLAEAFSRLGLPARVIDMDQQGSAMRWYELAKEAERPAWTVESLTQYRLKQIKDNNGGVTIIDCPPGDPQIIALAMDLADLVVVPCRPSPEDLVRTMATYEATPDSKAIVLLNAVKLGTVSLRQTLDALDDEVDGEQIRRFETVICNREYMVHAIGHVPGRLNGFADLAQEIREVLHHG